MVNEPMMVAARQLHDEARKWSSKVRGTHCSVSPFQRFYLIRLTSSPVCLHRETTSSALPSGWPCSWPRCRVWCAEAAETSAPSSSAPRTLPRPRTRSRGWPRRWPSSARTSASGPTCSRCPHCSSPGLLCHALFRLSVFNHQNHRWCSFDMIIAKS